MMSMDLVGKLMAVTCAMLWGLAIVFFKRSGESMSPSVLTLYKTFITAILFIPILFLVDPVPEGSVMATEDVVILCVSGILGIALADTLIFKCLNMVGAGLFGIIDSLYSPILIATSCLWLQTSLETKEILGTCLVVSAVLIATVKMSANEERHPQLVLGILIGALGMASMAISIIQMKPILDRMSVWWVTEIRLVASGLVLAVMVLLKGKWSQFTSALRSRETLKHALPGTLIGNFLAMTIWIAAFKFTDVHAAAILNQTSTIFIVIFASLLLKEPFTLRRTSATLLAFSGAVIVIL